MTNQDYKNSALSALRGHWSPAVVATIILLLIAAAASALTGGTDGSMYGSLGTTLVAIAVITPIEVGMYNAFLMLLKTGDDRITNNMFHIGFGSNYIHIVAGMVLVAIIELVGFILFIIPGLIWTFAYAMTPYILVENPEMSVTEALKTSRLMMKGHKFDLFYLYLSFIGWAVLSIITLGIGFIWLIPYMETAQASFWEDIKSQYGMAAVPGSGVDEQ